jgi:hypothetical protein
MSEMGDISAVLKRCDTAKKVSCTLRETSNIAWSTGII